ncbi:MAG: hypothetical protein M1383_02130 [Patescibacteria group bacterium]|nr:hypothetical protein [Patescibacteria group bacterium]
MVKKAGYTLQELLARVKYNHSRDRYAFCLDTGVMSTAKNILRVEPGEIIEVKSGYPAPQGSWWSASRWVETAGKAVLIEETPARENDARAKIRLESPAVVMVFRTYRGEKRDGIAFDEAYYCATDEQIAEAQAAEIANFKKAVAACGLEEVRNMLLPIVRETMETRDGVNSYRVHKIQEVLRDPGTITDPYFLGVSFRFLLSMQAAANLSAEDRDSLGREINAIRADRIQEMESLRRGDCRVFAEGQRRDLEVMGFSGEEISQIFEAARVSYALGAARFAEESLRRIDYDAFDLILSGASEIKYGKDRMIEALQRLGLKPPLNLSSFGLFQTLAGAHVAAKFFHRRARRK